MKFTLETVLVLQIKPLLVLQSVVLLGTAVKENQVLQLGVVLVTVVKK
jgi:hypothetical protein